MEPDEKRIGSAYTGELSPEQMARLLSKVKEPLGEHEKEKRRGFEVSTGFFDKLAALSAGSIAVAASILLTIAVKQEAHYDSVRVIIHDLLEIAGLLWVSLVLAILHNFLVAVLAKLDAAYSETNFIRALMRQTLSSAREVQPDLDDQTAAQVENLMHAGIVTKQRRLVKAKQVLTPVVTVLGCFSMLAFVAAYTLIVVYLRKLW